MRATCSDAMSATIACWWQRIRPPSGRTLARAQLTRDRWWEPGRSSRGYPAMLPSSQGVIVVVRHPLVARGSAVHSDRPPSVVDASISGQPAGGHKSCLSVELRLSRRRGVIATTRLIHGGQTHSPLRCLSARSQDHCMAAVCDSVLVATVGHSDAHPADELEHRLDRTSSQPSKLVRSHDPLVEHPFRVSPRPWPTGPGRSSRFAWSTPRLISAPRTACSGEASSGLAPRCARSGRCPPSVARRRPDPPSSPKIPVRERTKRPREARSVARALPAVAQPLPSCCPTALSPQMPKTP